MWRGNYMKSKVCNKCKKLKPFGEFYKDKTAKDGHCHSCKECEKEYKQANKEKISKQQKEYHQANKEKLTEKAKVYYQENQEKFLERAKKWNQSNKHRKKKYRQVNKERIFENRKEYYQANKERIAVKHKKYRQSEHGKAMLYTHSLKRRSRNHKVTFKPHERMEILIRDNWTCQCCGVKVHDESKGNWNTPDKAHIDHIIPISKGGDSTPINLRTTCRTCNLTKRDKQDEQLQLTI